MPIIIREESPGDIDAIDALNKAAFEGACEAELVNRLRQADGLTLSLVADGDGLVVGHIAFSPVTITSESQAVNAIGLGPMAVLPHRQRSGVGALLVKAGLGTLEKQGHGIVVVLGHPEYYPRFGFVPASQHRIRWEHDAPDEAFMVRALYEGALTGVQGVVKYRPEFDVA